MNIVYFFMEGNSKNVCIGLNFILKHFLKQCVDLSQKKNKYLSAVCETISDSTHIRILIKFVLMLKIDNQIMHMKGINIHTIMNIRE